VSSTPPGSSPRSGFEVVSAQGVATFEAFLPGELDDVLERVEQRVEGDQTPQQEGAAHEVGDLLAGVVVGVPGVLGLSVLEVLVGRLVTHFDCS
jgi:hypothetical protein